jgi:hypothetical protein
MLLYLKNIGTRRKFGYVTFELCHPIYIRYDCRHFEFFWAWLKIMRYSRQQKNALVISYRLVKTAGQNLIHFRDTGGAAFAPLPFM